MLGATDLSVVLGARSVPFATTDSHCFESHVGRAVPAAGTARPTGSNAKRLQLASSGLPLSWRAWDNQKICRNYLRLPRLGTGSLRLRGAMRYLLILLLLVALWFLLDEFLLKDRRSEGLSSLTEKLKDLGSRLHWSVGILAVFIVIIFVLRFLLRAVVSY